jgi:hypothetical protein
MAINPGFITLENNTITITEVNTTLDGGNQKTYNLENQISASNKTVLNLNPAPISSTLQVYVDGMLLKQGGLNVGDYVYDEVNRRITMNWDIDTESTVHVSYTSAT